MRITNNMLATHYLSNLNRNLTEMDRLQTQLSTGKNLTRMSDDPASVIEILSMDNKLDDLAGYQKTIGDAKAWLSQSETSVLEINEVVKTAYEKTLAAANASSGADEKTAIAAELSELRDHLVQVANATYGDHYIFGGYSTSEAPFTLEVDGSVYYQGVDLATATASVLTDLDSQVIAYKTGQATSIQVSLTGVDLMGSGDNNLIKIFDNLIATLKSNEDATAISPFISSLQGKQRDVLALATEIGTRTNRLDLLAARYEADEYNYTASKSLVEDADLAETLTFYKMAEASYEAALAVASKVIQPSLMDYLD